MTLRYKVYNTFIPDIFTESDEALCILLLEHNAEDYTKINDKKKKTNRKHTRPKYTKVYSINKKFKGCDRKGIIIYNVLVHAMNNRERPKSKEMEIALKLTYIKLYGRSNDSNSSLGSSGSEDSDGEDLETYDGFTGGS